LARASRYKRSHRAPSDAQDVYTGATAQPRPHKPAPEATRRRHTIADSRSPSSSSSSSLSAVTIERALVLLVVSVGCSLRAAANKCACKRERCCSTKSSDRPAVAPYKHRVVRKVGLSSRILYIRAPRKFRAHFNSSRARAHDDDEVEVEAENTDLDTALEVVSRRQQQQQE
jgi:hypothetical protein